MCLQRPDFGKLSLQALKVRGATRELIELQTGSASELRWTRSRMVVTGIADLNPLGHVQFT
jgi:hypothetical protein